MALRWLPTGGERETIAPLSFMKLIYESVALILGAMLLAGCAFDVVHVKQVPTTLDQTTADKPSWRLASNLKVGLGTGYSRTLKAGTQWDYVGRIAQGEVYKTKDQILTVEASNIHEAYVVVANGILTGFYLPVEQTFSPLPSPKRLPIEK